MIIKESFKDELFWDGRPWILTEINYSTNKYHWYRPDNGIGGWSPLSVWKRETFCDPSREASNLDPFQ